MSIRWLHKLNAQWEPFLIHDSQRLESAYQTFLNTKTPQSLLLHQHQLFQAHIPSNTVKALYWNQEFPIERSLWFGIVDGNLLPIDAKTTQTLEAHRPTQPWLNITIPFEWESEKAAVKFQDGSNAVVQIEKSWSFLDKKIKLVRGFDSLQAKYDKSSIGSFLEKEWAHVVFCVHGVGQKLVDRIDWMNFRKDVDKFRELINKTTNIQCIPVLWRNNIVVEGKEGVGVDDITLKNAPFVRGFVTDVAMDVLLYMTPRYCEEMRFNITNEMNASYEKFMQANPNFKGSVSILGHSLGSVLSYDILTSENPLKFKVKHLFTCGSPLGLFMILKKEGIDLKKLSAETLINVFHPSDPIAFRLEPLIREEFKNLPPIPIPSTTSMQIPTPMAFDRVTETLSAIPAAGSTISRVAEFVKRQEMVVDKARHDYSLSEQTLENQYISSLTAHNAYFHDADMAEFTRLALTKL